MGLGKGKRTFGRGALRALAAAALLLTACGDLTAVQDGSDRLAARADGAGDTGGGAVTIRVALGSVALAKKADTSITLDSLHLTLTSAGCPSRQVNLPVAGNINLSSQVLTATVGGLDPLRNWTVKAFSRDLSDSVLHIDSTTFYVKPADTARVSMLMAPRYSVLIARFVSTKAAQVVDLEKLVLRVDGVVVDDTTFASKRDVFDVKLSHKYLKAGTSATIKLEALDRASPARIRYSRTLTLTPRASGDSTVTVNLN